MTTTNKNTIECIAKAVKIDVSNLLKIIKEAGINVQDPKETLTADQQKTILNHLRNSNNKSNTKKTSFTLKLKKPASLKDLSSTVKKSSSSENIHRSTGPIISLDRKFSSSSIKKEKDLKEKDNKTTDENTEKNELEKKVDKEKIDKKIDSSTKENEKLVKDHKKQKTSKENTKPSSSKKTFPDVQKTEDLQKPLSVEQVLAKPLSFSKSVDSKDKTSEVEDTENKKIAPVEAREIFLPKSLTVAELAETSNKSTSEIIRAFFDLGEMITINHTITFELAEIALDSLNIKAVLQEEQEEEIQNDSTDGDINISKYQPAAGKPDIRPRAAIVTIMGHVDHGKTTLLDYIRKTKVAAKESGGITQHIGAYQVETSHGTITFLDTPGHEAFSAMRSRGANLTDIVVLVVAANDGVMPQTIEAINHAKEAGVPVIVAVNKIDKEDADSERIRTELSKHDLAPENWGGSTLFQDISALKGTNVEALLETIALQAEMLELRADFADKPTGLILESRVDKGMGTVATILVQSGTFRQSDVIVAGHEFGRIRSMTNPKKVKQATPSEAIEITGLSGVPKAGDVVLKIQGEKFARDIAEKRRTHSRNLDLQKAREMKNDYFLKQLNKEGSDRKILPIILRADVHGTLEAIKASIAKATNSEGDPLLISVIDGNVGAITSSDIIRASTSGALIIGFNVRADAGAKKMLTQEQVPVEYFSVIYNLLDFLTAASEGIQEPKRREVIVGNAFVKEVFRASKTSTIAGCMVTDGVIKRLLSIRLLRENKVIFTGEIDSLRRFKDEADEVKHGTECGIGVKGYSDVRVNDVIEAFTIETTHPKKV